VKEPRVRILKTGEIRHPEKRARVAAYLLRDETTHCLLLQGAVLSNRGPVPEPLESRFWAAERDGEIVGVAAWTPPLRLLVSRVTDDGAIPALVAAVQAEETLPLGLLAPDPVAGQFADEWCRRLRFGRRLAMRECVYDLETVRHPSGVTGAARLATERDRSALIRLAQEFATQALTEEEQRTVDVARFVEGRFRAPNCWQVWEDGGEIASIASANGETPNAMRIGPVYTPPRHRRRGYASGLTAAVAQRILDTGHRRAMLFTDLANPTSNHIYRSIGFRPVAAFSLIAFTPQPEDGA
jgi:GNAT superfamily N-acetyltransferase